MKKFSILNFQFSIRLAFVSLFAVVAFCSCNLDKKNEVCDPPPLAASTKTWTIESPDGKIKQTWSDEINVPACNKSDYKGGISGEMKADCRSYNYGGTTYYYYNWQYVMENHHTLCPDPWRVPTYTDFVNHVRAHTGKEHDAIYFDSKPRWDEFRVKGGWLHDGYMLDGSPGDDHARNLRSMYYWSGTYAGGHPWVLQIAWKGGIDGGWAELGRVNTDVVGFAVRCVR